MSKYPSYSKNTEYQRKRRERLKNGESVPTCSVCKETQLRGKLSRERGICTACYNKIEGNVLKQRRFRQRKSLIGKETNRELELKAMFIETINKSKLYKLHGENVVLLDVFTVPVPDTVRRYKLRGSDCVRVRDIEQAVLL